MNEQCRELLHRAAEHEANKNIYKAAAAYSMLAMLLGRASLDLRLSGFCGFLGRVFPFFVFFPFCRRRTDDSKGFVQEEGGGSAGQRDGAV
jgi:hypothetical protein